MKAIRLVIRGRVQGVGYRAWLERQARAARLGGWVRNRRDGSVEALIAGPEDEVDALAERARTGPPLAAVAAVLIEPALWPGDGFHVLPTAD